MIQESEEMYFIWKLSFGRTEYFHGKVRWFRLKNSLKMFSEPECFTVNVLKVAFSFQEMLMSFKYVGIWWETIHIVTKSMFICRASGT